MLPFLHERLQRLRRLLEGSNAALVKYNELDLDLAAALTAWLDEAVAVYRDLGRTEVENRLLALKAGFVSAQHGVHPQRLEVVRGHRRTLQRTIALHALQEGAEQVRADHRLDEQALAQGKEELVPLVLTALEQGLLAEALDGAPNQARLQEQWQRLLRAPATRLAARHVAMRLNATDILLLLEDVLAAALVPAG